jgi:integrase
VPLVGAGEMLELERSRVDFANRTVELKSGNTKGKERRLVPLNDTAYSALLRLRRVCDEFFPDTEWVFTHTKPRYFGKRILNVRRVSGTAVKRAGIDHATSHCLRHTSTTEGVHVGGANVVDISRVAGHKDLPTLLIP